MGVIVLVIQTRDRINFQMHSKYSTLVVFMLVMTGFINPYENNYKANHT